ncbi:hypothetical protein AGR1C_pAt30052 [Agrobacterium fabacearum TT111]|nr:hypothetical protein AGR1C_pAt30052 [Agrobacterium fabacearum TT111]
MWKDRMDGVCGAKEIDVKQATGVLLIGFLNSTEEADPGVVDQDVDPTVVQLCGINNLGTDLDR